MKIVTRSAVIADAPEFSRIGAATFALACPPATCAEDIETYIRDELSPARFAEQIACPSKRLYAAEVGRFMVGYLMLCLKQHPVEISADKPLELRRLYVLPALHGSGVAGSLMAVVFQQAVTARHDVIWLGVSKQNQRGIGFYRKYGFRIAGEQKFAVGRDIHDDFIMSYPVGLRS